VVQVAEREHHLLQRVQRGLSVLLADQVRHLLGAARDFAAPVEQMLAALRVAKGAPDLGCLSCARDGGVDLLLAEYRYRADDLAGGGVDRVQCVDAGAGCVIRDYHVVLRGLEVAPIRALWHLGRSVSSVRIGRGRLTKCDP